MVIRSGLVSLFILFSASSVLADDDSHRVTERPDADAVVMTERSEDRIGAYGTAGLGLFGRSDGLVDGGFLGGEAAYAFHGGHGLRLGYAYGVAPFGPEVHAFDFAYSFQWNTRPHLRGVTMSFGALLGPSMGIVNYLGNEPDIHATFGGRAGGFADVNLWMVTVGLDASYRFGFSTPYGAESFGTVGLHAGVTFELAKPKRATL